MEAESKIAYSLPPNGYSSYQTQKSIFSRRDLHQLTRKSRDEKFGKVKLGLGGRRERQGVSLDWVVSG